MFFLSDLYQSSWRQPGLSVSAVSRADQSQLSLTSFCSAKLIIIQSTASSNLSPLITGFNDLRFASFNTTGLATSSAQHIHNITTALRNENQFYCEDLQAYYCILLSCSTAKTPTIFLLTSEISQKLENLISAVTVG